jgi:hypothetical protein
MKPNADSQTGPLAFWINGQLFVFINPDIQQTADPLIFVRVGLDKRKAGWGT